MSFLNRFAATGVVLGVLLSTLSARANVPEGSEAYCSRTMGDFRSLIETVESRISFANYGGFFGRGLCWWHSRLQRNSVYLSLFAPEKPRLTDAQASQIVSDLINAKRVVEIPGYSNFYEFSADYKEMIHAKLAGWQKKDSLAHFAWVRGLRGGESRSASEMKKFMDDLYDKVEVKNEIVYTKLQLPGLVAHAWLVIGVQKVDAFATADVGAYKLRVIDSSLPQRTLEEIYVEGDTQVSVWRAGEAGIFEEHSGTLRKIRERFKKHCGVELR
jgi:hypothetical protein